jgi:hypothetical protein
MVFNATFNNISVISWRSVLLVEETGLSGENHRPVASHWQTLSHNVTSSTPRIGEIRTDYISVFFSDGIKTVYLNFYIVTVNLNQLRDGMKS